VLEQVAQTLPAQTQLGVCLLRPGTSLLRRLQRSQDFTWAATHSTHRARTLHQPLLTWAGTHSTHRARTFCHISFMQCKVRAHEAKQTLAQASCNAAFLQNTMMIVESMEKECIERTEPLAPVCSCQQQSAQRKASCKTAATQ
jgi:hypothetical protein